MANVLNRETKLYLESVNTPEYDPAEWLINPDLSAVEGHPTFYWTINPDDTVSLKSDEERADVDTWLPYTGADLATAIRIKQNFVNAHRDQKLNGGWLYKGVYFDSDVVSRSNMTGIMTLIGTGYVLPDSFTFRAQNNVDIPYTNATFTEFYKCSCIWANMVYKVSWYHKSVIAGLTSIPEVASYDCSGGWPIGYEG
jgi:hypothetical protein